MSDRAMIEEDRRYRRIFEAATRRAADRQRDDLVQRLRAAHRACPSPDAGSLYAEAADWIEQAAP